ncbi:MAG TPA: phosphonatase-like hydrolase [Terriglobales bacterium]|nr:phosphonatase-like hydrolase [Terriglobales bacterium]
MRDIRLVIFDIAGTIIEDHGEVVASFRSALLANGMDVSDAELREWKGASKREVIRRFAADRFTTDREQKVEKTYADFRQALENHYQANGVIPIAGAEATFRWLRERKILIATTTGFYREIADFILKEAGWFATFNANVTSSDVAKGRPAPDMILRAMEATGVASPSQVVNVGDTPLDLQAGTNAGAAGVIGVLTGAHAEERLRREPHTHIIPSVADLPALLSA